MATIYKCPDCGQQLTDNLNDCPNCGCSIERINSTNNTTKKKDIIIPLILGVIIIIISLIFIVIRVQEIKQIEEQVKIEHARIEQERIEQERIERAEREKQKEAERLFQQNQNKLRKQVIGTWYSNAFFSGNSVAQLRLTFYSTGELELAPYHPQVGRKIGSTEYGEWDVIPHDPDSYDRTDYLIVNFYSGKKDMVKFNRRGFSMGKNTFYSYNPY